MVGQIARCKIRASLGSGEVGAAGGGGQGRHIGVIAWNCNPTGRGSAVLSLLSERRRWLALIQTGYTELLLNDDERTKEEVGNVNFKRPGLGTLALWLPAVEAQKWMQIH